MQARDSRPNTWFQIHLTHANLQMGLSRVFNRSWASVFRQSEIDRVNLGCVSRDRCHRSNRGRCWHAQFMCPRDPTNGLVRADTTLSTHMSRRHGKHRHTCTHVAPVHPCTVSSHHASISLHLHVCASVSLRFHVYASVHQCISV